MSTGDLKFILEQPLALFLLMLFGSLLSIMKQLRDARENGSTITTLDYLLRIETVIMFGGNVIAFITLIMTDTLNWTGAIAIGYAANSLADLKPRGRSAEIVEKM